MAALTLRLDEATNEALRRLVAASGKTRSDLVRSAILRLAEETGGRPGETPFGKVAHLLGSVKGIPKDLSERTGERFSAVAAEKRRRRTR